MPAIVSAHRISFYAVPKVACTSLKLAVFEIENGFAFKNFRINGTLIHIHNFYVTSSFDASKKAEVKGHVRFAVVRDPVARLVSAYRNRVLFHNELSESRLAQAGVDLPPKPDIETFVMRLKEYQEASPSIRHHTLPMTFFLGEEVGYFDRLFSMSQLLELENWLRDTTKLDLRIRHEQQGGPKLAVVSVVERFGTGSRQGAWCEAGQPQWGRGAQGRWEGRCGAQGGGQGHCNCFCG